MLYDDNHISIEDDTKIAKSEDVAARYEAYGWHVQRVDWLQPGGYHEDVQALYQAYLNAQAETTQPSLIVLRTIIAWPAPDAQNTGAAHGAALGADEVAKTKRVLGFDPEVSFPAEEEAVAHARQVADRGEQLHAEWDTAFTAWARPARTAPRCWTGWPRAGCRTAGQRAAQLPAQRQRAGHPGGIRAGAERPGPATAGTLGRVGRPGRE